MNGSGSIAIGSIDGITLGRCPSAVAYADKVLAIQSASLIAYWPLWEASGATADNYEGTAARDGTYVGSPTLGQTGIGDGRTSVLLNGSTQYINVYTASLLAGFDGEIGTVMIWYDATNWSDGNLGVILKFTGDGTNSVLIRKGTTNDEVLFYRIGENTVKSATYDTGGPAGFACFAMTYNSAGAGAQKHYYNGSQVGATLTGLGGWDANPVLDGTDGALLGANDTVPQTLCSGRLAHAIYWNTVLSGAEISGLGTV